MADPYVIFPGTSDHIQTDDVNLMDADSAHLVQSIGKWSPIGSTGSVIDYPAAEMGRALELTAVSDDARLRSDVAAFPVTAGVEHVGSFICVPETDLGRIYLKWFAYDNTDSNIGSGNSVPITPLVAGQPTLVSAVFTPPAEAVSCRLEPYWDEGGGATIVGSKMVEHSFCLREGSDPSFVPSLRIVGSLFEETIPADMPISFAADGTPLTIGEGWAGNGYAYNRYDGADSSAPLVASFQAGDVPVAAQLPG